MRRERSRRLMLLLNTAALPTLRRYRHPNLGRLCVPDCKAKLAETLELMPTAFDNGCFHGLDPVAVCRMYETIAGWPPVGARLARAWPGLLQYATVTYVADGGFRREITIGGELPPVHPNLLWCTVPDVVRCRCGNGSYCRSAARGAGCAPVGDADATRERWEQWMPWLAHLPLAYVLQDGAERPGRVPWGHPCLKAVFVGGSDAWRYGPECAELVRHARHAGLLAHFGRISSLKLIRYAQSIGATSFDSSRYSRWRDLTLDDGLSAAAQPPQLRLVA